MTTTATKSPPGESPLPKSLSAFRSRIVREAMVPATDLKPNPLNWRVHPDHQRAALEGVLDEVGWVQRVIVNERTGTIVDGHLRLDVAKKRNEPVPVIYVDLTDDEERIILATLDPIAALATGDNERIRALVDGMHVDADGLKALVADLQRKVRSVAVGLEDPDAIPDAPDPVTKTGDLVVMGDHRLVCGDATIDADVARLMDGAQAGLCFTDPPYNVAYGSRQGPRWGPKWNGGKGEITNDALTPPQWLVFCARVAEVLAATVDGCVYVCHAPGPDGRVMAMALDTAMHPSTTIIWNKNHAVMGRGKYHNKYEPIWFGWTNDGKRFSDRRDLNNVWPVDRPGVSEDHPTMKPVDLIRTALDHASAVGDVVFDPFLGSGSTVVACEQLGRRCFGMEIEPAYCDVIVRRWEEFTGKAAEYVQPKA